MNLTKTFAAALAASTIAGSAVAADLPSRKMAPSLIASAPIMTWTGFYLGLNAGGVFGGRNGAQVTGVPVMVNTAGFGAAAAAISAANDLALTGTTGGGNRGGFIGGGQIGYNWQIGSMVTGLEADIQGMAGWGNGNGGGLFGIAGLPGFAPTTISGFTTATNRNDWLGTVRGRLGFLPSQSLLLYATGGLAYGGVKSTTTASLTPSAGVGSNSPFGAASLSTVRVGWTIGGGAEWMFARNWSAKLEYMYYDLGSVSYNGPQLVTTPAGGGAVVSIDQALVRVRTNGHIVRAGLNYHFNWGPAPVVAKY